MNRKHTRPRGLCFVEIIPTATPALSLLSTFASTPLICFGLPYTHRHSRALLVRNLATQKSSGQLQAHRARIILPWATVDVSMKGISVRDGRDQARRMTLLPLQDKHSQPSGRKLPLPLSLPVSPSMKTNFVTNFVPSIGAKPVVSGVYTCAKALVTLDMALFEMANTEHHSLRDGQPLTMSIHVLLGARRSRYYCQFDITRARPFHRGLVGARSIMHVMDGGQATLSGNGTT